MKSRDGLVSVDLRGRFAERLPVGSVFESLSEASTFFEGGSLGYSATRDPRRLDGIVLQTRGCQVERLEIEAVRSSYFADQSMFPAGSAEFDHALIFGAREE